MKTIIKYFFYPRMVIANEKYNFLCFIVYLVTVFLVGKYTNWLFLYSAFMLIYLMIGENLPKKWLKEFYNVEIN